MQHTIKNISLNKESLRAVQTRADAYVKDLVSIQKKQDRSVHESSLFVPTWNSFSGEVKQKISKLKKSKFVILVGIGGSNLGTEAIYHALGNEKSPELVVLDSIDNEALEGVELLIRESSLDDLAFVVISKSGSTTETLVNATLLFEICEKKFGTAYTERTICIGDAESPLNRACNERGILTVAMPAQVGGRYSVFTEVGLIPLAILGIDTVGLRNGAQEATQLANLKRVGKNASMLHELASSGVHTVNFFTFSDRLSLVGNWYRQLLAESIGKNVTLTGAPFTYQLLPIVSTAVDLHSMAELYLSGCGGMYTRFFVAPTGKVRTVKRGWVTTHVPALHGKNTNTVADAIVAGVLRAYAESKSPHEINVIERVNAFELGFLMNSLMAEVIVLGKLFLINPFIQPSVEHYKKHTRAILDSSKK